MDNLTYKIEVFEGPMDLLLHLISKHKLNINDIPIVELVNQYLDYVRKMEEADFDVAGDFLEMAARLIYIKTVSLLPRHEEAETLKKELTGELIEYRDCKLMAKKLSQHTDGFDRFLSLFDGAKSKSDIVATFLAVLELTKTKKITVDGDIKNPNVRIVNGVNEVDNIE